MASDGLTARQARFLAIVEGGTVAVGLRIGEQLYQRGLLTIAKWGRYGITPIGQAALDRYRQPTQAELELKEGR